MSQLNVASPRLLEDTVDSPSGSRASIAGVALNHVLSRQVSLAAQYFWTSSTTPGMNGESARLPLYPDRAFSIGTTWVSPKRIYVSAGAMRRGSRAGRPIGIAAGAAGLQLGERPSTLGDADFAADWTAAVAASWEAPDKRWSVESVAGDLLAKAELHARKRRPSFTISLKFRQ